MYTNVLVSIFFIYTYINYWKSLPELLSQSPINLWCGSSTNFGFTPPEKQTTLCHFPPPLSFLTNEMFYLMEHCLQNQAHSPLVSYSDESLKCPTYHNPFALCVKLRYILETIRKLAKWTKVALNRPVSSSACRIPSPHPMCIHASTKVGKVIRK